jgi:ABC-type sulfate transport system substrate-binding protein
VLDTGARGSTVTFAQKELGDVLLAWENEAFLVLDEFGADNFDIVFPPTSILAEPPVAIVDKNVEAKGTEELAKAYLDYLYSPKARRSPPSTTIVRQSRSGGRSRGSRASRRSSSSLLMTPSSAAGRRRSPKHFGDGGIFDQIYAPRSELVLPL